ncbi:MAG: sulfatase-like hydrolase/transferase [Verrucomicrobia bacterium]|nr:sulfatase-like hydrolase/transferase [Verrucomicrobiota bacterium]
MKHALTFLLCPLILLQAAFAADARKPNLLLIYSDDHGWADLGAQGVNAEIRTPSLDQLASDGVRFTRGYVSAPQCVPSRAGVLTGRYQQRFGVEDNGKGPLPLAELTIAERLKPAGYVSGQVGKWHLDIGAKTAGSRLLRIIPEHMPHGQGFDEYWRGELRQFYASHDLKGKPFADAPHIVTDNRFRVVVQTEAALSFLDRRTAKPEQPWFLYLAWYAPHVPLESPEPWFSQTPENLPLKRRQALAMIAGMDDGLGRIRAKLREIGAEKDTLIFFIGDNGAPLGGAWNGSLNFPLIGQKGMLAEGGIRTPFIAAWPGKLPAGATYDQPVISLDVAATAIALAGLPHDEKLDGVNIIPFVTGEKKGAPHDTLYWRWGSQAAVQEMPYKLIMIGERERLLFDITKPDGENLARNLVTKHPDIAARLEAKLQTWAATLKPPGLPTSLDPHHEDLFAEHDLIPKLAKSATPRAGKKGEPEGSVNGWLCRNGALAVKDGALAITPDPNAAKNARAFLTHSGLDVAGPVTATLRVRAKQGGQCSFSWRTKAEKDFIAENTATAEWPTTAGWQEIKVSLPIKSRLMHLRITPAKASVGLEIQSIELGSGDNQPQVWNFNSAK